MSIKISYGRTDRDGLVLRPERLVSTFFIILQFAKTKAWKGHPFAFGIKYNYNYKSKSYCIQWQVEYCDASILHSCKFGLFIMFINKNYQFMSQCVFMCQKWLLSCDLTCFLPTFSFTLPVLLLFLRNSQKLLKIFQIFSKNRVIVH